MAGPGRVIGRALWRLTRTAGGLALTAVLVLLVFLVLPLMEQVSRPPDADLVLQEVDTAELPPPPPPPPEEEQEDEPEEEPPPELQEEAPPLDLSQLELALDPGGIGEGFGGDFAIKLFDAGGERAEQADEIFSMAELDQQPRVVYQPAPSYPPALQRKKQEGTVYVIFVVDLNGRVQTPRVQQSTHPAFEGPALKAVRRWRFEPGKRKGQSVRFRMRVPITFMMR